MNEDYGKYAAFKMIDCMITISIFVWLGFAISKINDKLESIIKLEYYISGKNASNFNCLSVSDYEIAGHKPVRSYISNTNDNDVVSANVGDLITNTRVTIQNGRNAKEH